MIGGIIALVIGLVVSWIYFTCKAIKDPDVQASADLRIPILRYNKYKQWYDEHQRIMHEYGIGSKEDNEYFISFFKQIGHPNEWRRYQNYRWELSRNELNKII